MILCNAAICNMAFQGAAESQIVCTLLQAHSVSQAPRSATQLLMIVATCYDVLQSATKGYLVQQGATRYHKMLHDATMFALSKTL